jgi:hypothetical protein
MVLVKNLTLAFLKECTLNVIKILEDTGYFVFRVIININRVNRNMFAESR